MTEFDPAEDLDPLDGEALARVRRIGSGSATPRDIEDTKRWGQRSAAHAAALARASLLWDRLGAAGDNLVKRRGEPVLSGWERKAPKPHPTRRAVLGGALAASAAVSMVAWPPFGLWPSAAEMLADYRTSPGQQRRLTTAGGVRLTLNTETSLNLRSIPGRAVRIDILSGEVAIATGDAATSGVLVVAGDGQASAEQARFDVRSDGSGTCVTCLDGAVRVERQGAVQRLRPGQQVAYGHRGLEAPISVDPAQVSAWQEGLLIFHYAALTDVVAEVNRYRPGRVIVTNAALGRRLVNGRFRIDNVDSVLAMFQQIFGAKVTRLPGGIVLLS